MAHELEFAADGKAMFASLRQPAWHGLGTVFDNPVSTSEMLKLASLDKWDVRLVSVADKFPEFNFNALPYLVVRNSPVNAGQVDVLGQVGERYNTMQNEDVFTFGDEILDGGGQWETAGSIKNGTVVFGSLSIDKAVISLDPSGANDQIVTYLLVYTSHNGSKAISAAVTPVRVVCQNTWTVAVKGAKQSFSIRHTQSAKGRVDEARRALGITFTYMEAFEAEAKALFERSITEQQFHDLIAAIYPEPATDALKGAHVKWENKRDAIVDLYHGPTCANIKGTAWGAVNAISERIDWGRSPRKGNNESMFAAASGFDPVTNVAKGHILKTAKDLFSAGAKPKAKKLVTV